MKQLALLAFLASPLSGATDNPMRVAVAPREVVISNVARGGTVVLFSCSRIPGARSIAVEPAATLLRDDDNDGVIRSTPKSGIAPASVWVAVDAASGETASGAPPDFPLFIRANAADALRKDIEEQIAAMAVDLPRLSLLVVRPGAGAWMVTAFDGRKTDRDGEADGRVRIAFEDAVSVQGKDKGPKHLKKGDVVVAIDPGHLDVFLALIDK
jgi:hypothetical protein